MRTTGTLSTHITQEVTTLATLVKMTLVDSTVMGFTNHDRDIVFDSVTYLADNSYTPTDMKTSSALNVDNLDIIGVLDSAGITAADIRAGVYDGATVEFAVINWKSPADGIIKLPKCTIGNITRGDVTYIAELRSLTQKLQQGIVESFSLQCRADLGDTARCKVRLDPPQWAASTAYTVRDAGDAGTGSVVKPAVDIGRHFKCTVAGTSNDTEGEPSFNTTIGGTTVEADGVEWETIQALSRGDTVASFTDTANFAGTNLDEADDFWNLGKITWLTGNNAGRSMEVKDYTLTGKAIELYLPMPAAIQIGDTFNIETGCNKDLLTDCKTKFDNVHNNRSETYTPNRDQYVSGNS